MSACKDCGAPRGFPAGWTFYTQIDPATMERVTVWRCPDCGKRAGEGCAMGTTPKSLAQARKRGGQAIKRKAGRA